MEQRVRVTAAGAGISGPSLMLASASVNHAKREFLAARGYRQVRSYFRMERPLSGALPLPEWPAGVEIRPVLRHLDDADLHETLQEAFADHYRFMPEPLDEWSQRNIERADFVPELSFVARAGGQAVAAVVNYLTGDQAWIGIVGVRPAWRRRGLASALMLQSFHVFRQRGIETVGLGVDSENAHGAMRVYEQLGMTVAQQHDLFQKTLAGS
jgi:ribosomal protein S18 acetylase RimI-like enzyme